MSLIQKELKAKDVMTVNEVCIGPWGTIRKLAHLFETHEVSGVPVVDQAGKVIGEVIPEPLVCVEDFMTEDPLMVGPELSAAAVARMMFEHRVHRAIVADDEKFPIGIITSLDLLGAFPQMR